MGGFLRRQTAVAQVSAATLAGSAAECASLIHLESFRTSVQTTCCAHSCGTAWTSAARCVPPIEATLPHQRQQAPDYLAGAKRRNVSQYEKYIALLRGAIGDQTLLWRTPPKRRPVKRRLVKTRHFVYMFKSLRKHLSWFQKK